MTPRKTMTMDLRGREETRGLNLIQLCAEKVTFLQVSLIFVSQWCNWIIELLKGMKKVICERQVKSHSSIKSQLHSFSHLFILGRQNVHGFQQLPTGHEKERDQVKVIHQRGTLRRPPSATLPSVILTCEVSSPLWATYVLDVKRSRPPAALTPVS